MKKSRPRRRPRGTDLKKSRHVGASEILDAGCAKWPSVPSRTLARMLFKANPGVWASIELARKGILYRRGRAGHTHRGERSRAGGLFPSTAPSHPWNPEGYLPPSDERPFTPHRLTFDRDTRVAILGDIHIPYHNLPALRAALGEARRREVGAILLNGDTLDFYKLSRFSKDPRARDAKKEIDLCLHLLDAIDEQFPKARKIWKDGNHDERYAHYLMAHAPELFEVLAEHAALPRLLELKERGWEYVTEKRPVHLGKLSVIHGHEYPTPVLGPVNAARGLFLRAKACAIVNHHHQTSEHTEPTIRDEMITTWSIGCLCALHPEYARFNKWNHGAAEVEVDAKGNFSVRNYRIHHGKVMN